MKIAYKNFTGGEISGSLSARYDLSRFAGSCRHLENFIPELHGPLRRRMGTRFLEDLGAFSILLPFEFSSDPSQNYAVIVQEGKILLAQRYGFVRVPQPEEETGEDGTGESEGGPGETEGQNEGEDDMGQGPGDLGEGSPGQPEDGPGEGESPAPNPDPAPVPVPGEPIALASPYRLDELYDISFAQSGDIMYLAHRAHPLMRLTRHGHTDWRLEEVTFSPAVSPPEKVTVTHAPDGTYILRYKVAAVNEKGETSDAAPAVQANSKHVNDWVAGDYFSMSWEPVEGALDYNIYREEAGTYGLIGVTSETSFRDDKYAADTRDTPCSHENPFTEGNNPGLVCFHQQRLIVASTALQPQTWFGSRTGNYEDFSKSRPVKDDDSLEFTLASGRIDVIQWIAAFGDLVLGTAGSEYKAIGSDQGTITPTSLNVREQSYWGSIRLKPLIIGNSVLHVQRQGSRVRDLFYSLERDGYAGNDLSVMASHLFDNRHIMQWDYRQSPGSTVWAVRDDGMVLVLTYMKEHEIWGWSRVTTQGKYRSVICTAGSLEDDLYMVVEREVEGRPRWYLEMLEPRWFETDGIEAAFYVDCGLSYNDPGNKVTEVSGLGHLEGLEVSVLADGSPVPPRVVENGRISLPYAAGVVHVGLGYNSVMCPQTPESDDFQSGATLGRVRAYGDSTIDLISSVGGKYGPALSRMYPLSNTPEFYDTPVPSFTGFRSFSPGAGYDETGRIWFMQDQPLPFTIAALMLDVDIQGY